MAEDEKFISRWAKRKAESRAGTLVEETEARDVTADTGETQTAALSPGDADVEELPEDHPAAGIDIESLNADSDFSVFMHEKVPQAIRRRALRKLWFSDPIFSTLDGLNDYDEDFTDAATVVEGLKAAYDEAVERRDKREAEEAARAQAKQVSEAEGEEQSGEEDAPEDEAAGAEVKSGPEDGEVAEVDDEDLEDGTDEA